jgi:hypothetical protein
MSFMNKMEQKISKIVMNKLLPRFKYAVTWLEIFLENTMFISASITIVYYDNRRLEVPK